MNNVIVLSAYKYEKEKKKSLLKQPTILVQEDKETNKENTLVLENIKTNLEAFNEIIKKNKEIKEKLKQERQQTNTNVKKSYRLE